MNDDEIGTKLIWNKTTPHEWETHIRKFCLIYFHAGILRAHTFISLPTSLLSRIPAYDDQFSVGQLLLFVVVVLHNSVKPRRYGSTVKFHIQHVIYINEINSLPFTHNSKSPYRKLNIYMCVRMSPSLGSLTHRNSNTIPHFICSFIFFTLNWYSFSFCITIF